MTDLNNSINQKSLDQNDEDGVSSFHDESFNSYHSFDSGLKKEIQENDAKPLFNPKRETLLDQNQKEEEDDNSFIIPTYEHRFSRSKISRSITYQSSDDVNTTFLHKKKFAIAKSSTITTFLLNLTSFSQFTNPKEIQKDQRIKAYFLVRDAKNDKFIYDINDILSVLSMENENKKTVDDFLKGINAFFDDYKYLQVKKKNTVYKWFMYGSIVLLISLIVSFFLYGLISLIKKTYSTGLLIAFGVLIVLFCALLLYQILGIKNVHIYTKFNIVNYMVMNYASFFKYVESWNRSIFESNRIRVTIPVTIDYILFNMDPYQEIKITDINIKGKLPRTTFGDINRDTNCDINAVRETQLSAL